MGKKNNDWTKKLKGTSQRKLEALEKKVWVRKQRVAQLIKNGVQCFFGGIRHLAAWSVFDAV